MPSPMMVSDKTRRSDAIEAKGLVKHFGPTTALRGIDLQVPQGCIMGLLEPNGAGKTTIVRVLATLLRPDEGNAMVGGYDVVRKAHQVRQLIGLTGQYAAVDEKLTGAENLVMLARLLGVTGYGARSRAAELLTRFGLSDAAGRKVSGYSGGMRRRLDLAATLVGHPRFLYLDEPTAGLDPYSRSELWKTIRGLVTDGATALLTTQYLEEADQLADRIAVIDRGSVIASGTTDEFKTNVGGQVLDVRAVLSSDLGAVQRIVTEVIGEVPTVDIRTGLVTVSIIDSTLLAAAVRKFDDEGVAVAELALRRPSLDEAFRWLTGSQATDDISTSTLSP